MERIVRFFGLMLLILLLSVTAWAVDEESAEGLKIIEAASEPAVTQPNALIQPQSDVASADSDSNKMYLDPVRYTLGPEDIVQIDVMRHPEFSGVYPVNLEGKIQYKFVGDIDVSGLNKKQLEEKVTKIISNYVISPEVNITIVEYKSKVIYVLGEVGQPGRYYMRVDSVPVREAVVNAGLPTYAAAMRRCRLITPDNNGKVKTRSVDLYSVLYGGDLNKNIAMHPGDVLYVPATVMAKIIRVINPVTSVVGMSASGPEDVSRAKSAATTLAK
ncbi:MAG: polysaccharide biosynthesis/export family protein [Candidatus Omnitrophota bacterium]|nr:polysaccharide biosynthesis/export family protein [Candidatus Omnitrophota bacterium]